MFLKCFVLFTSDILEFLCFVLPFALLLKVLDLGHLNKPPRLSFPLLPKGTRMPAGPKDQIREVESLAFLHSSPHR